MKVLISYAYFETENTKYNLDFFSKIGIINNKDLLFLIIINGDTCSVELPKYENCIIIKRPNIGFDFGSHNESIKYLINKYKCSVKDLPFDAFIFMNCGTIGPFLPTYYPKDLLWTNVFTSKLNENVKLVGTTIVCLPFGDAGGYGPRVEGFCFCLDKVGLNIIYNKGTIFCDHATKTDAIINGEYGLSIEILHAGYTLDCLLYKYEGINWRNFMNWNQNGNKHPSRNNSYEGICIHPFEVVFHKWLWAGNKNNAVLFEYVNKYKEWKLKQLELIK